METETTCLLGEIRTNRYSSYSDFIEIYYKSEEEDQTGINSVL